MSTAERARGALAGTGEPAPATRIQVAVLGSCMTRDNFNSRFNPGYRTWYRVAADHHMPSLLSVVSPPTAITDEDLGGLAGWDAAKIRTDFSKSFLAAIAAEPPAYLVVDFSGDIRAGALQTGDGRWVTHHGRLRRTPWHAARRAAGTVHTISLLLDTDAYLDHWAAALATLDETVRRVAPGTTIVLHRGLPTTRLVLPGTRETIDLVANRVVPRYDTPREIGLWRQLDEHAVATFGWPVIDLRGRDYPTSDAHPWGARYLHYSPDRYPDFLAALHAIHLERTAAVPGPEAASMAAFVAGRAAETDRGRPWDDEPGRGHRRPKLRTPRAPRRGPVRRLRRLAGRWAGILRGRGRRGTPAA